MSIKRVDGILKAKWKVKLATMPRLAHWVEREKPFDIHRSEVVKWLIEQAENKQMVFDKARESGAIVFDELTNTWRGVDTV